jgi:hypothetical protein
MQLPQKCIILRPRSTSLNAAQGRGFEDKGHNETRHAALTRLKRNIKTEFVIGMLGSVPYNEKGGKRSAEVKKIAQS